MKKLLLSAAILISALSFGEDKTGGLLDLVNTSITKNGTSIRIFSRDVQEKVKLMIISDTHLFCSDSREDPYRQFSARMAKAYNKTKHFQTGADTNPEECFLQTLEIAKQKKVDAIILLGDLVSYPSEAGIEWSVNALKGTGIPFYYTSGNHDWHYEGMPGSDIAQMEEWTQKRLLPLYDGHNPLIYDVDIKGVKIIMLSNGAYELLPEQLSYFKKAMRSGKPALLMSHIPFYEPTRAKSTGSPLWKASIDKGYKVERRQRWPEDGFSKVTFDFWKAVLKAASENKVLASFAGHIHKETSSVVGAWHQFTVRENAAGAYYIVTVEPMPEL